MGDSYSSSRPKRFCRYLDLVIAFLQYLVAIAVDSKGASVNGSSPSNWILLRDFRGWDGRQLPSDGRCSDGIEVWLEDCRGSPAVISARRERGVLGGR
jgi:hypothetical protein